MLRLCRMSGGKASARTLRLDDQARRAVSVARLRRAPLHACLLLAKRPGTDRRGSGVEWQELAHGPLPIRPVGRDAFAIKRDRLLQPLLQAHDGIAAQPRLRARDRRQRVAHVARARGFVQRLEIEALLEE